ncbi:hypothetical protein [Bradyrhizobium sp. WD16]|uniref:hypothetical protein n=1 Tax=Bradyrhizobium sp. WD16 TaxID=1521768 RepID=UPI0020A543E8|nr:hypothetical protein [Bradyrhizobium sp. WD16]
MAESTIVEVIRMLDPPDAWTMRWHFVIDINGDGQITISDVWLWASYIFFAPGDVILLGIMLKLPSVAAFLEMTPKLVSGWWSFAISFLFWAIFLGNLSAESKRAKEERAQSPRL